MSVKWSLDTTTAVNSSLTVVTGVKKLSKTQKKTATNVFF